jgi:glycosyltransferase involved in cell wall biosynthesis
LLRTWGRWIIRLPRYPMEEMPFVVAAAHIVVVPHRQTKMGQAQFPLKLTDGMAMAKPILSTKVGDIPMILNDTGYLVAPDSPDEIASQLQWIFDHWEEAKLKGQLARKRCIEFYSTDAMGVILAGVIEQCFQAKVQTI